jgi:hypothetical protein
LYENGLVPDIPLGPFEGSPITGYAGSGKTSRLHARLDCSQLRATHVQKLTVPICAATIRRMCGQCARWGPWARPGTALEIFLSALGGTGLTYELTSHTEPDPDEVTDQELTDAAMVLQAGARSHEDEDDAGWDEARAARELLDSRLAPVWCSAMESLFQAADVVARYPWLKPWASSRLALKTRHADALRQQIKRLVDPQALVIAAAASLMKEPVLPSENPAFGVLGRPSDVQTAVRGLWRRWRSAVSDNWLMPREYSFLEYGLEQYLGNRRKGRDQLRSTSREMLGDWADAVSEEVVRRQAEPDRLILITAPARKAEDGSRIRVSEELTHWELGVLALFAVATDWARRTFLVRTPSLIAERLLTDRLDFTCVEFSGDPADEAGCADALTKWADEHVTDAGYEVFLPGSLDDTPVSSRRPVGLAEVRALREVLDDPRKMFVVFSVSGGLEIMSLARIEKRCEDGWRGALLAEAGDLPSSLIRPWLRDIEDFAEDDSSLTLSYVSASSPTEPDFGQEFAARTGELALRALARHRRGGRELERGLRVLALSRGMYDLRQIDDHPDPRAQVVPQAVWHALLAAGRPDLRPFLPPDSDSSWPGGSGLPLGVLAEVQIYTTNADRMVQGKGHSPFCQHAGDRGVTRYHSLLTLADLIQRQDLDWCSKCGGYATRRLNDTQVAYYRSAHRLHEISRQLSRELNGQVSHSDLSTVAAVLDETTQWLRKTREQWQDSDVWRLQEILRDLDLKSKQLERYRRDGWPDSGQVLRLRPRRPQGES